MNEEENEMIRIRESVVRIRGSGSITKHYGSGTLKCTLALTIKYVTVPTVDTFMLTAHKSGCAALLV